MTGRYEMKDWWSVVEKMSRAEKGMSKKSGERKNEHTKHVRYRSEINDLAYILEYVVQQLQNMKMNLSSL